MKYNRATLIEAIALNETQLAQHEAERQALLETLHDLRQQLSAIDASSSPASEPLVQYAKIFQVGISIAYNHLL